MTRGVYVLFVGVALLSLNGCAVGTEGDEPPQDNGKTARSGTLEIAPPAAVDDTEARAEAQFFDESTTRTQADNPFLGKEPGLADAPRTKLPAPKPVGPHN